MRRLLSGLALALVTGCAFSSSVQRAPGAPQLDPSGAAIAVATAPAGAVALGIVTVQGNNLKSGADCEAQAVFEAKRLGATHVVVRPANSFMGSGTRCTGEAFFVGDVEKVQRTGSVPTTGPSIMRIIVASLAVVALAAPLGYYIGSH